MAPSETAAVAAEQTPSPVVAEDKPKKEKTRRKKEPAGEKSKKSKDKEPAGEQVSPAAEEKPKKEKTKKKKETKPEDDTQPAEEGKKRRHKKEKKGNNSKVKENAEKLKQEPEFDGELGEFERECMNQHNLKRPLHSAGPLGWSEECAEHARMWVKHLVEIDTLAHDNESGMGENCGYFQSSNVSSKSDSEWAVNVSNMWYGEIEKYDFDKSGYQSQTGHFTQMIWKSTTKMGCAIAKKGTKVYIVANYYPPGNFMSRYPENVSKH